MPDYTLLSAYNLILIRYNEIWLKSRKVKMRMLHTLVNNIKTLLQRSHIKFHKYQLSKDATRILFFLKNEDIEVAIQIIRNVFGIHSLSPALRTSDQLKNIREKVIEVGREILSKGDSFAIRAKRSGKHEFSSKEVAEQGGEAILNAFPELDLSVNLSAPKKKIFIEVRGEFSYVYTDVIPSNWGGLPIEQQKKILVMDIGRLEDILAGFLLMRRGAVIYPVVFQLTEEEQCLTSQLENWRLVAEYFPGFQFFIRRINMIPVINIIIENVEKKEYVCALCRLIRFKIISKLLASPHIEAFQSIRAITDGITLNNATSCNDEVDLQSISMTSLFFEHPVFTPIIASDPQEIAKEIKQISASLLKYGYCQFAPRHQLFDAKLLQKLLLTLDIEALVEQALQKVEEKNVLEKKDFN